MKLARVVNTPSKVIGNEQNYLSSFYNAALKTKATHILYDHIHPVNGTVQKLPQVRRLKVPLAKKT